MQFIDTIKSWQVWFCGAKMQNGGKPSQNRPSLAQNMMKIAFIITLGETMYILRLELSHL